MTSPDSDEYSITIRQIIRQLWRRRNLIVIVWIVAMACTFFVATVIQSKYKIISILEIGYVTVDAPQLVSPHTPASPTANSVIRSDASTINKVYLEDIDRLEAVARQELLSEFSLSDTCQIHGTNTARPKIEIICRGDDYEAVHFGVQRIAEAIELRHREVITETHRGLELRRSRILADVEISKGMLAEIDRVELETAGAGIRSLEISSLRNQWRRDINLLEWQLKVIDGQIADFAETAMTSDSPKSIASVDWPVLLFYSGVIGLIIGIFAGVSAIAVESLRRSTVVP